MSHLLLKFSYSPADHRDINVTETFLPDTCEDLPDIFNLRTDSVFPVNFGTAVTVACIPGYYFEGDSIITCVEGRVFSYGEKPSCALGKSEL